MLVVNSLDGAQAPLGVGPRCDMTVRSSGKKKSCAVRWQAKPWGSTWQLQSIVAIGLSATLRQNCNVVPTYRIIQQFSHVQIDCECTCLCLDFLYVSLDYHFLQGVMLTAHAFSHIGRFAQVLGFKGWGSRRPCLCCKSSRDSLHDYLSCSLTSLPWQAFDHEDYIKEVKSCLVKVVLRSNEDLQLLLSHLEIRKSPWAGRLLTSNLDQFGLLKWDKVQPTADLKDIHAIDGISAFPAACYFFRVDDQKCLSSLCPLMSVPGIQEGIVGFGLGCVALDTLHTLDLGVSKCWLAVSLYVLLDSQVWSSATSMIDRREIGAHAVRDRLKDYYKLNPSFSRIDMFKPSMLGSRRHPEFHCQAAESRCLVPFVVALLSEHSDAVGEAGRLLLIAGKALEQFYIIMKSNPRCMPEHQRRKLLDACLDHNTCYAEVCKLGHGRMTPKHHLWVHIAIRAQSLGNPSSYHTYADESFNGVLAKIANVSHPRTLSATVVRRTLAHA